MSSQAPGAVWGRPHAVIKVHVDDTSANQGGTGSSDIYYNYDPLGRQFQSGPSRTITYTDFDLPRQIVDGNPTTTWTFHYDANHQRTMKIDPQGGTAVYLGKLYEKRTAASGTVSHVMYVPGDGGEVVAQVSQPDEGGLPVVDYLHGDHLASVAAITGSSADLAGTPVQMRFDPFGSRIGMSAPPNPGTNPLSRVHLGFTGQEEDEDGLNLVNLNGRIYDPTLMRFLTADPFVTRPMNSQEFNRYSYANNSPFHFTDRSGFQDVGREGTFWEDRRQMFVKGDAQPRLADLLEMETRAKALIVGRERRRVEESTQTPPRQAAPINP